MIKYIEVQKHLFGTNGLILLLIYFYYIFHYFSKNWSAPKFDIVNENQFFILVSRNYYYYYYYLIFSIIFAIIISRNIIIFIICITIFILTTLVIIIFIFIITFLKTHKQGQTRCYTGSRYDSYVRAVVSRRLIDEYNCTVAFAVWGYSAEALRRENIRVCRGRRAELAVRHFETILLAGAADWGNGIRSVVERAAFLLQSWALLVFL